MVCNLCKRKLNVDKSGRLPRHTLPGSDAQCLGASEAADWLSLDERIRAEDHAKQLGRPIHQRPIET